MKARASLSVLPEMEITMTITMTVREMRSTVEAMQSIGTWPAGRLREVISKSLQKASDSFDADEHDVSPS